MLNLKEIKEGDFVEYENEYYEVATNTCINDCSVVILESNKKKVVLGSNNTIEGIPITKDLAYTIFGTPDIESIVYESIMYTFKFEGKNVVNLKLFEDSPIVLVEVNGGAGVKIKYLHELQHILWAYNLNSNIKDYGKWD